MTDDELLKGIELINNEFCKRIGELAAREAVSPSPLDVDEGTLLAQVIDRQPHNIFTGYIRSNDYPLCVANFLLYFLMSRDFDGVDGFIRSRRWQSSMTPAQMRAFVPECEVYVEQECSKISALEARFLKAILAAIKSPGTTERF